VPTIRYSIYVQLMTLNRAYRKESTMTKLIQLVRKAICKVRGVHRPDRYTHTCKCGYVRRSVREAQYVDAQQ